MTLLSVFVNPEQSMQISSLSWKLWPFIKMCRSVDLMHYLVNIDLLIALTNLLLMIHDWIMYCIKISVGLMKIY